MDTPQQPVAKFIPLITETLTESPKRIEELYQIALERQPQDCTDTRCPHRPATSKVKEWQHLFRNQLWRVASNWEGKWHLKALEASPAQAMPEQPAPVLPAAPAPEKPYTGDPFILTSDGLPSWARPEPHFMDTTELEKKEPEDRFVVPLDFDEFYAWRPDYVLSWVKRRLNRFVVDDDVEDWTQDLLIHLRYLPQQSQHRQPGSNGRPQGCQDVIETFNPVQQYGASERRFRNYVNNILSNKFLTVQSKRQKNPVLRSGNVSYGNMPEEPSSEPVAGDEFVHANSDYLAGQSMRIAKQHDDRLYTNQFKEFVANEDPGAYPAIEALEATGTIGEAAKYMGVSDGEFTRLRNRLKQLGECFEKGLPVPKQRRPYKKRAKAASAGADTGSELS